MRAAAQVVPVALAVQADRLAGRNAGDDLGLVLLALRQEVLHRLVARQLAALHRQIRLRQLAMRSSMAARSSVVKGRE